MSKTKALYNLWLEGEVKKLKEGEDGSIDLVIFVGPNAQKLREDYNEYLDQREKEEE